MDTVKTEVNFKNRKDFFRSKYQIPTALKMKVMANMNWKSIKTVSYTHLDVYKRQDMDLFESDLLDSLAFAELLVAFEEQLGVVIAPSEVERKDMDTPNKIIELVKARS